MKTKLMLIALAAASLAGCSKKKAPSPQEPGKSNPVPVLAKVVKGHLLKSCDIALIPGANFRTEYAWNADSSLKSYKSTHPATQQSTEVIFHYQAGTLARVSTQNSLSEGVYVFKNGKIDRITSRHLINPTGRNYYFTYDAATGNLARIRYYNFNEAGEQLVQEVNYTYDAQQHPSEIVATQPNGNKRFIRFQEWSAPFLFSPWIFSESEMDLENYELYNVPLLFALDRMPTKFSEHQQPAGGAETVTRRWEISYTIQQERLDFRRARVIHPGNPQLDRTVEHTFRY